MRNRRRLRGRRCCGFDCAVPGAGCWRVAESEEPSHAAAVRCGAPRQRPKCACVRRLHALDVCAHLRPLRGEVGDGIDRTVLSSRPGWLEGLHWAKGQLRQMTTMRRRPFVWRRSRSLM